MPLRVYVDGPRTALDATSVREVINVARSAKGFSSVEVIERSTNLGLYKSLTSGISQAFDDFDAVIVFEDDLVTSPFAIKYFLDALSTYRSCANVASIHGWTPPIREELPETFFLRGADCWGWATWRDQWSNYRHDATNMAYEIKSRGLVNEFNLNGSYDYFQMLCDRANGLNNSWAICWMASCFLLNKVTLHPGHSLVQNIGLDYSGEHCGPASIMSSQLTIALSMFTFLHHS